MIMQSYTFHNDDDFIQYLQRLIPNLPNCNWKIQGLNVFDFPYDTCFGPLSFNSRTFLKWLNKCKRMQECNIKIYQDKEVDDLQNKEIATINEYDYYYIIVHSTESYVSIFNEFFST